jgi:hypothetical protein
MKLSWIMVLLGSLSAPISVAANLGDGNRALDTGNAASGQSAEPPQPVKALGPLPEALRESLDSGRTVTWSAQAGESLRGVLQRWTEAAGWTLVWATGADRDVVFEADVAFPVGTSLREALTALFASLAAGEGAAKACEYSNRTLRVVALGARCD